MDHAEFRSSRRFASFDGVRAVAAVAVVLFHFAGPSFAWASGWLGVHVFFVLSGFLITTLSLREADRRGRLDLTSFYIRRAFRIWPAYFAVLAVLVVVFAGRGELGSRGVVEALPWFATFNADLRSADILYGQAWTIGIEQKFYLLWPVLAFLPWVRGLARRSVVMVAVPSSACSRGGRPTASSCTTSSSLWAARWPCCCTDRETFAVVAVLARPIPAALCWVLLVGYQLSVPSLVALVGSEPPVVLGYGVVFAAVMPSLALLPVLGRLLGGRVMAWWGDRSYSIYLVQLLAAWVLSLAVPRIRDPPVDHRPGRRARVRGAGRLPLPLHRGALHRARTSSGRPVRPVHPGGIVRSTGPRTDAPIRTGRGRPRTGRDRRHRGARRLHGRRARAGRSLGRTAGSPVPDCPSRSLEIPGFAPHLPSVIPPAPAHQRTSPDRGCRPGTALVARGPTEVILFVDAVLPLLLTLVHLVVPGVLVGLAAGTPLVVAVVCSPVVTFGLVTVLSRATSATGLGWAPWTFWPLVAVSALAVLLLRRALRGGQVRGRLPWAATAAGRSRPPVPGW